MKQLFGILALFAVVVAFAPTHSGLHVGDTAPDFKLKDVTGKMVSLSDFEDAKGFIVTFTCNTCPFAVMYEDRFIELHNKYAPQGYHVIAINPNDPDVKPDDSFAAMGVRSEEKGFTFSYLFDEGQKVYPAYGATRTPHIFLLDNKRKVKYIGALDNNAQDASAVTERYVEDAIAAMERGENPDPSSTKAIGCSIKAKR
ncbi:MAG: thioredoxin family protein [Saprospiraceae bacterium]|jgi:peroxiredoxin|nr:thioredoxin family protein [Saprospiraceae bacterium]